MINGNVNEFVEGLYYGDERWFLLNKTKYFIQGWVENNEFTLVLDFPDDESSQNYPIWSKTMPIENKRDVVESFLNAPIFNGKTFWEVEKDIEWVDE